LFDFTIIANKGNGILDYLSALGGLFGGISAIAMSIITFRMFKKDRPIISCEIPYGSYAFTCTTIGVGIKIQISLSLCNEGLRGTTIKNIILKRPEGEEHLWMGLVNDEDNLGIGAGEHKTIRIQFDYGDINPPSEHIALVSADNNTWIPSETDYSRWLRILMDNGSIEKEEQLNLEVYFSNIKKAVSVSLSGKMFYKRVNP